MTVAELLERADSRELSEWMIYFTVKWEEDHPGEQIIRHRMGSLE